MFVVNTAFAQTPVVLISIDGFANHYLKKYQPPNISFLAGNGAKAQALLPVYPTKTFPNHLSIVTGKYPQQHGIVHNKFYHKALKENYRLGAGKHNSDWLTATPIWALAEQQGLASAIYFWPESETKIEGKLPSYYFPYQHNTPNAQRVEQVVNWLKLPINKQPKFIALYFSTVDSAGHHYGSNSKQLAEAINAVDQQIGRLIDGVKGIPVNIILVSDHGMVDVNSNNRLVWQKLVKASASTHIVNGQTQLYIYEADKKKQMDVRSQLLQSQINESTSQPKYRIYQKGNYPSHWHFTNNFSQVIPDLIVDAIPPYTFVTPQSEEVTAATHGYDLKLAKSLEAIFIANGPSFKQGTVVEPFENVLIYSIISRLLGLELPNDVNQSKSLESALFK